MVEYTIPRAYGFFLALRTMSPDCPHMRIKTKNICLLWTLLMLQ